MLAGPEVWIVAAGVVVLLVVVAFAVAVGLRFGRRSSTPRAAESFPTGWSPADKLGSYRNGVWTSPKAHQPVLPAPTPVAGWYHDPKGRFEQRYWYGSAWTNSVLVDGSSVFEPGS